MSSSHIPHLVRSATSRGDTIVISPVARRWVCMRLDIRYWVNHYWEIKWFTAMNFTLATDPFPRWRRPCYTTPELGTRISEEGFSNRAYLYDFSVHSSRICPSASPSSGHTVNYQMIPEIHPNQDIVLYFQRGRSWSIKRRSKLFRRSPGWNPLLDETPWPFLERSSYQRALGNLYQWHGSFGYSRRQQLICTPWVRLQRRGFLSGLSWHPITDYNQRFRLRQTTGEWALRCCMLPFHVLMRIGLYPLLSWLRGLHPGSARCFSLEWYVRFYIIVDIAGSRFTVSLNIKLGPVPFTIFSMSVCHISRAE